jgi:hypothetical protein
MMSGDSIMGHRVVHHATHFLACLSRQLSLPYPPAPFSSPLPPEAKQFWHHDCFGDEVFSTTVEVWRPGRKDPLGKSEAHKAA